MEIASTTSNLRAHAALIFAVIVSSLFVFSATAHASVSVVRYASPTGTGPIATCAELEPCSIRDAVDGAWASFGDEVILAPGTYSLGSTGLAIGTGADIHGTSSAAATRIVFTGSAGLTLGGSTTLSDVQVESPANAIWITSAWLNNVISHSTGGVPCVVGGPATLTGTMCVADNPYADALAIGDMAPFTVNLQNVTAVSPGSNGNGIRCVQQPGAGTLTVNAVNVIARGGLNDVYVVTGIDATCDVSLTNSNFASTSVSGGGSITNPATNGNQTAAPLFDDAAGGDFRQAAGSPTIDAGTTYPGIAAFDLDGDARETGAAVDIGADEYVVPPPLPEVPAGDTTPPDTTIESGPAGRTRSSTAKFRFSSSETGVTYACQLDGKPFKACSSPATFKVKPGKHKLRIVATDAAGNADPVHAFHTWRVLKPR